MKYEWKIVAIFGFFMMMIMSLAIVEGIMYAHR